MALGGRDQTDWTFPVLVAICAAFAATAAGTVLAPLWFWLPLAVLAVCAVTILAYRYTVHILRHLAAARRRHAGDDPGRPARAVGVPKHDRHRERVRLCARRAVRDALRLLCGLFQSQPRLPGNVPVRLCAWSPPRADAGGQPALTAGLRGAVRIRVQPPVTGLVPDDHPSDGLDPAAVRGGRRHPGRRQPPLAVCRQRR